MKQGVVGVDLGQFALDPFGSGVQRVLQQLALHWPEEVDAEFLVPINDRFGALSPADAHELISTIFKTRPANHEAARVIAARISDLQPRLVTRHDLPQRYSSWLMPEMSYDAEILDRLRSMATILPLTMIGYDALPMSNPENYFFTPGTHDHVSEYFRLLREARKVACISEFSRMQLLKVLRRSDNLETFVAHPGGDHVLALNRTVPRGRPRFLRVGTMEARKQPIEITEAFSSAVEAGLDAELVFVGSPSRVDVAINSGVWHAVERGVPITWVTHATDDEVMEWMQNATAFLSFGIEGYGLPVLEAIRRGLPVIFDGIQPAAEIMEGRGALRRPLSSDPDDWRAYAEDAAAAVPDASGVPRWADFARSVAEAAD